MLLLLTLFLIPSSRDFAASHQMNTSPLINFSQTCFNLSVDQRGLLKATCFDMNHNRKNASIGLDGHIGNSDGRLVANGIHFTETCVNLGLTSATLDADCKTLTGHFVGASCNLDNNIDNTNGVLVWQTGHSC
jgi:hypothetical protein